MTVNGHIIRSTPQHVEVLTADRVWLTRIQRGPGAKAKAIRFARQRRFSRPTRAQVSS